MLTLAFSLPETFWPGVVASVVFGVLGLVLLLVGFKVFDSVLPKLDFQDELKGNPVAVAIVIGAFLLGVAHIVASVVH